MLTAVLLTAVLLSVTVQLKSPVPPVFWATYCTVSASAAVLVPFTVNAFQPRHDAVPSSLLVSKPTSTNGPAPHLICLSTFTLQVSQVSCAVAVFFTVIVTALLPLVSRSAQSLVTVRPGV